MNGGRQRELHCTLHFIHLPDQDCASDSKGFAKRAEVVIRV